MMISPILFSALLTAPADTSVTFTCSLIWRDSLHTETVQMDEQGNMYLLLGDVIKKYDQSGKLLVTQSFKGMGKITSLDVSNSLRPFLFYRDLNRMVMLDNTLSIQGQASQLEKLGFQFVTLACQSPMSNTIWLYDQLEFRLLRVDRNFQIINNSGNITQITGKDLDPLAIQEFGNMVYMNDPNHGILVFDMFGTYIKTIPLKGLGEFQVTENGLFYTQDGELQKYDFLSMQSVRYPLPCKVIFFRIGKNRLYISDEKQVSIFSC
jgi:hypothetical protein